MPRLEPSVAFDKVSASASPTSGNLTPRFFISSLLSSCILPLEVILYLGWASWIKALVLLKDRVTQPVADVHPAFDADVDEVLLAARFAGVVDAVDAAGDLRLLL